MTKASTRSDLTQKPSVPLPVPPLSIEVEYKAKSSYPVTPSASPEGTIGEQILYPVYSTEQHQTWAVLLEKHAQLLKSEKYLCQEYTSGMKHLDFPTDQVAALAHSSKMLHACTGWQIIRVEGLVPPEKFFALLANKVFPCTDFIRHFEELDYTPAPDTFHDQVGHLPMITDTRFAQFFHSFGIAGSRAQTPDQLEWFNRIYWFTVEFGLINPSAHLGSSRDPTQTRIYGSGIASSCGEILHCLSDHVVKRPFDLDVICGTDFDIHHMQDQLFEISSFDELEDQFRNWAVQKGFLP